MNKSSIRNFIIFIVLVLAGFIYVTFFQKNNLIETDYKKDKIILLDDPYQENIDNPVSFNFKGFKIIPLANFRIKARVLSCRKYKVGKESKLSPMDLALGWGRMANPEILKKIKITQGNRWYYWKTNKYPIPRREIETHSANMHIIPATKEVKKILMKVKKGNIVYIEGKLIEVLKKNWHWKSSLSRKDTGSGSCELVWAKKIIINPD